MLVLVCSREGGISYNPVLNILPKKMSKHFSANNLIFIYPSTVSENAISNYEQEITGGMLEKSLNLIRRAKNMLSKKDLRY